MVKLISIILVTLTLSITIFANAEIDQAISLYKTKEYKKAEKVLNKLILEKKDSVNSPKAIVILTKIYLNQKKYRNVQFLNQIFNENYSNSANKFEMSYLSSQLLINQQNHDLAYLKLIEILKNSNDPHINVAALTSLKSLGLSSDVLNISTLKDSYSSTVSYPQINNIVLYSLALKSYEQNDFNSSTHHLKEYIAKYKTYSYYKPAKKLLNNIENRDYSETLIAVLVPLTGKFSSYGKKVLNGVKLQLKEAGLSQNIKIYDNESNPVVTIAKMKEIVNDKSIKAVIGPVSSDNVIAAAAIASLYNVPMITPTATDHGISDIGNNIYQLNLTIEKLAQKIGNYAVDSLEYKTYLIVAPKNSYGQTQAEEFEKAVSARGGRVIKTQFYTPGQQDYKSEMTSIRRVLLTEKIEQENFQNGRTGRVDQSRVDRDRMKKENLHVDGIFIPATNSNELIMLIPQILYYRIYGNLLGSSSWYSNNIITNAKEYINNSYFSLYFYKIDRFEKRLAFENNYEKMYGRRPTKVEYLSYDASEIIINSINKGNKTPSAVNNDLQKLNNFQGVSGYINFYNNSGANSEAEIIKINNNRFIKLER